MPRRKRGARAAETRTDSSSRLRHGGRGRDGGVHIGGEAAAQGCRGGHDRHRRGRAGAGRGAVSPIPRGSRRSPVLLLLDSTRATTAHARRTRGNTPNMPPRWAAYVRKHNKLADFAAKLLMAAHESGAVWMLENPADCGNPEGVAYTGTVSAPMPPYGATRVRARWWRRLTRTH
eukprot:105129-Pleurochrysis_carterae.AAC.4